VRLREASAGSDNNMPDAGNDMNDLARRASNLLFDVMDVPRHLKARIGPHSPAIGAAEEMVTTLEMFVHELRRYHAPLSSEEPFDEV
jgi:hypothetical protein